MGRGAQERGRQDACENAGWRGSRATTERHDAERARLVGSLFAPAVAAAVGGDAPPASLPPGTRQIGRALSRPASHLPDVAQRHPGAEPHWQLDAHVVGTQSRVRLPPLRRRRRLGLCDALLFLGRARRIRQGARGRSAGGPLSCLLPARAWRRIRRHGYAAARAVAYASRGGKCLRRAIGRDGFRLFGLRSRPPAARLCGSRSHEECARAGGSAPFGARAAVECAGVAAEATMHGRAHVHHRGDRPVRVPRRVEVGGGAAGVHTQGRQGRAHGEGVPEEHRRSDAHCATLRRSGGMVLRRRQALRLPQLGCTPSVRQGALLVQT
mmetsp:Transcript_11052/g.25590  ORF Transcript_11052/g.25590 Transcript_11052/m.25590 type:complete len:325 (-) Transcript_11052:331-1305(-)